MSAPPAVLHPPMRVLKERLPAWPLALPFVGYPAAWALGLGDTIWPLGALLMLSLLVSCRGEIIAPPGFVLWLGFLVVMLASAIQLDTAGRGIGFAYRAALYLAATIMAIYAYNAPQVSVRYACGVLTIFLLIITVFGLLAFAFPMWTFRTPLSWIIPGSLQQNELIGEMVVRRMTQFDPDAWSAVAPRPSAPFIYTNTWGNVYSLVLPIAALYAWLTRGSRRSKWVVILLAVSVVPAVLTLNRGMFVGLGVVIIFVSFQTLRAGRFAEFSVVVTLAAAAALAWLASPTADDLAARVEVGNSTQDRASLYSQTIEAALASPIFGYGAPRSAEASWLPPLGTQGQLWTILFSHGFIATAFFLLWFCYCLILALGRLDRTGALLGGVVAATLVETAFYGMMTGLMISLLASVLLFKESPELRIRNPGTIARPLEEEPGDAAAL